MRRSNVAMQYLAQTAVKSNKDPSHIKGTFGDKEQMQEQKSKTSFFQDYVHQLVVVGLETPHERRLKR